MIVCKINKSENSGISVYGFSFFDEASGKEIYRIDDVFTDRVAAQSLCETVNASDLCREHIMDIIEDAVASI